MFSVLKLTGLLKDVPVVLLSDSFVLQRLRNRQTHCFPVSSFIVYQLFFNCFLFLIPPIVFVASSGFRNIKLSTDPAVFQSNLFFRTASKALVIFSATKRQKSNLLFTLGCARCQENAGARRSGSTFVNTVRFWIHSSSERVKKYITYLFINKLRCKNSKNIKIFHNKWKFLWIMIYSKMIVTNLTQLQKTSSTEKSKCPQFYYYFQLQK